MSAGLMFGSTFLDSCASLGLAVVKTEAANGKLILPLDDFKDKKIKLVRVKGYEYDLAVRETGDGTYLALLLKCTHAEQPLTKTGNGFYCTLHGSQFAADGTVEKGPASRPLQHLPVKVENNNLMIFLDNNNRPS